MLFIVFHNTLLFHNTSIYLKQNLFKIEIESLRIIHEQTVHHNLQTWSIFLFCYKKKERKREKKQPLENVISSTLIPSFTGQSPPGDLTRDLLALPCKHGGLGITSPLDACSEQRQMSKAISAPLIDRVIKQESLMGDCASAQQHEKTKAKTHKQQKLKSHAENLKSKLPSDLQKCIELSQEKGASIWLTALPINAHSFALHKAAFRDALSLRYHWPIHNQPSSCACGHTFSIDHALSCPTGEFPSIRHNEVRDITGLFDV